MPEAKTSKLKSLRKESDKAKIILPSFFHLVRDLIPLCTRGKEAVCRRRNCCDRRPVQHSIAPKQVGYFRVKLGQRAAETRVRTMKV
jgi:hypothetical protein